MTLVDTVQPGVGIFIDGIYQPNTSYLNNPLIDVERVEVLRGPQGTLYGKNTLGGAINVITRQPGNEFEVQRHRPAMPGRTIAWSLGGSVSGPIIEDRLQARIAYAHREQDGFIRNNAARRATPNPLNTDALNATIRADAGRRRQADRQRLLRLGEGRRTSLRRSSPARPTISATSSAQRDQLSVSSNIAGINAKLELPLDAHQTKVTLIGAYDAPRRRRADDADGDFTPADIAPRQSASTSSSTRPPNCASTAKWSTTISTLSSACSTATRHARRDSVDHDRRPASVLTVINTRPTADRGDTYAAFGTLFWQPTDAWEVAPACATTMRTRTADGGSGQIVRRRRDPSPTSDDAQVETNCRRA